MIIGFWHLENAISTNQILAFNQRIVATPAITGKEKGHKVLKNLRGR